METVLLGGVRMSIEAARVAEAAGVDPATDVEQLRGQVTRDELLTACLDGVEDTDAKTIVAWGEYVAAVAVAASRRPDGQPSGTEDTSRRTEEGG